MSSAAHKKTQSAWLIATFFGIGHLQPGPGTYGSAAAAVLWYAAARWFQPSPTALILSTLAAAIVVTLIGIPASTTVARESGRKDPGFVVIDEVAGQLFALALTSAVGPTAWAYAVLAFILFRAFDITKPWIIRSFEALPEGQGIMLDDVAAGLFALVLGAVITSVISYIH
jgi:phosphatidylglycerophosphatase A